MKQVCSPSTPDVIFPRLKAGFSVYIQGWLTSRTPPGVISLCSNYRYGTTDLYHLFSAIKYCVGQKAYSSLNDSDHRESRSRHIIR